MISTRAAWKSWDVTVYQLAERVQLHAVLGCRDDIVLKVFVGLLYVVSNSNRIVMYLFHWYSYDTKLVPIHMHLD